MKKKICGLLFFLTAISLILSSCDQDFPPPPRESKTNGTQVTDIDKPEIRLRKPEETEIEVQVSDIPTLEEPDVVVVDKLDKNLEPKRVITSITGKDKTETVENDWNTAINKTYAPNDKIIVEFTAKNSAGKEAEPIVLTYTIKVGTTPQTHNVTIETGTDVKDTDYEIYKSDKTTKVTDLTKVEAGDIYVKVLVEKIKVNGKAVTQNEFSEAIKINADTTIKIEKDTGSGTSLNDNFTIESGVLIGYKGNKPTGVVTIPDGVTTIGKEAFTECHEIESVVFPKSLTTIEEGAFFGAPKLKEVDLSSTQLKSIGKSAFCGGLGQGLEKITFPESLEEIGELAFKYTNLKEVDLSKTKVKKISLQAFLKCEKLEKVILPSCLETIEKDGFSGCSTLTNINLGNTQVTSIGLTAFENTKLAEVNLSKLPATLGDEVFRGATLGTVIFPESLTSADELKTLLGFQSGILKGCKSIKIVDLSKTKLTNIAEETFALIDLEVIKFPSSLNEIGCNCFLSSLNEVHFPSDDDYNGWTATDPEDSSSVVNIDDKIKGQTTIGEKANKFAELLRLDILYLGTTYGHCTWTKN